MSQTHWIKLCPVISGMGSDIIPTTSAARACGRRDSKIPQRHEYASAVLSTQSQFQDAI